MKKHHGLHDESLLLLVCSLPAQYDSRNNITDTPSDNGLHHLTIVNVALLDQLQGMPASLGIFVTDEPICSSWKCAC